MRAVTGIAAVVAAAALSLTAADVQANLLANPGFEGPPIAEGPPPFTGRWQPFGGFGPFPPTSAATNGVDPHTGLQHLELQIDNVANTFAGVFQDVPGLTPGDNVEFSGWHLSLLDAGGIEIRIEWRDSVNDIEITRTPNLTPTPGALYEPFSLPSVVPAGADTARVVYAIQSFGAGPNQLVRVDDLSFVPEPASLALLSLGGLAMLRRR